MGFTKKNLDWRLHLQLPAPGIDNAFWWRTRRPAEDPVADVPSPATGSQGAPAGLRKKPAFSADPHHVPLAHGCDRGGRRGAYQQATADGFALQHEFVQVAAVCGHRCGGSSRADARHFTILCSPGSVPFDLLWLQHLWACVRLSVSACVGFGFRPVAGAVIEQRRGQHDRVDSSLQFRVSGAYSCVE